MIILITVRYNINKDLAGYLALFKNRLDTEDCNFLAGYADYYHYFLIMISGTIKLQLISKAFLTDT